MQWIKSQFESNKPLSPKESTDNTISSIDTSKGGIGGRFGNLVHRFKSIRVGQAGISPRGIAQPPNLESSSHELVESIKEYASIQLQGNLNELECLESMNRVASVKFTELASTVDALTEHKTILEKKHEELAPLLSEIDLLYKTILALEATALKLDSHSKSLEASAKRALDG